MSYKKLTKILQETERVNHDDLVVRYLAKMMEFTPLQMHFFDESSVLTTSGNRAYGHSDFGTRAIETQKFASNSTLTVNVCCGFFGINYYNILNGASNAMEMVNVFAEALEERNELGNPTFARGDVIVMDNCGFHHQHQGERILRYLLDQHGVTLVFQPPYSPQYNVTECVFQIMKRRLQYNSAMVENFLELTVVDALDFPASFMSGFFRVWICIITEASFRIPTQSYNLQNGCAVHPSLTDEHVNITPASKMRNKLATDVLNKNMLYLMKQYQTWEIQKDLLQSMNS
ncbi:uncharacterized protein LOC117318803 [Pecten maximus]|uniref:uncharacterized protein LOC117318803 n=1 Tax=Pecten maximus TaxID=6579 RepID=UPI0014588FE7|nr:uncharacterized protein LOC117318803 [Pecten maximus]